MINQYQPRAMHFVITWKNLITLMLDARCYQKLEISTEPDSARGIFHNIKEKEKNKEKKKMICVSVLCQKKMKHI